jgi:CDP-glucose 4,6-dehydratase
MSSRKDTEPKRKTSDTWWRDRPVLVTGATGLVGGWTVRRLVDLGADVVCLVRDHVPPSELVRSGLYEKVKSAHGDVRDQALLERVLGEYETQVVVHLAAQTIVGIANRNPVSTFETNVGGTWSMLEAARRSPTVKSVVIASSDKAYGQAAELPTTEKAPLDAVHPYDVSKSCADLIARSFATTFGVPVAITRCGNFFGGGDLNWNRIVPGTIRSVIRGEDPVIRSDGRFVRDYIYVEDAATAYTTLARALAEKPELKGEAFNFSYEKPSTVREIVDLILEKLKSKAKPRVLDEASNEIREQHLDASKARKSLGWKPEFELDAGLDRTIEWYRKLLAT